MNTGTYAEQWSEAAAVLRQHADEFDKKAVTAPKRPRPTSRVVRTVNLSVAVTNAATVALIRGQHCRHSPTASPREQSECGVTTDKVTHGTTPDFSNHHYVDLAGLCRRLGHLPVSPIGGACARCGDPVFSLPDGTPWPPREQTR